MYWADPATAQTMLFSPNQLLSAILPVLQGFFMHEKGRETRPLAVMS